MPALFADFAILFAQVKAKAPAAGAAGGSQYMFYLMIGWLVVIFYVLYFRPQQKQEQARKALMSSLKKNDRVLTSSGIYGTVTAVDPDQDKVSVRIDDDRGVKVVFTRASIVRIIVDTDEKSKDRTSKEKATESA